MILIGELEISAPDDVKHFIWKNDLGYKMRNLAREQCELYNFKIEKNFWWIPIMQKEVLEGVSKIDYRQRVSFALVESI